MQKHFNNYDPKKLVPISLVWLIDIEVIKYERYKTITFSY